MALSETCYSELNSSPSILQNLKHILCCYQAVSISISIPRLVKEVGGMKRKSISINVAEASRKKIEEATKMKFFA